MKIYFDNDGSYGQKAVGVPVLINDRAIGYVCEVTASTVVCELFNRYIKREQIGLYAFQNEQDIRSIGIKFKHIDS